MRRHNRYRLPPLNFASPAPRECDKMGCAEPGEYRAPKNRALKDYHWFCIDHVREYNASWNFYRGMKADELDAHWISDMTWQRPSWPLGASAPSYRRFESILRNRFLFEEDKQEDHAHQENELRQKSYFPPYSEEAKALKLFALQLPLSKDNLRKKYKQLVKQSHPDHHQGNKDYEERLKNVTQAYAILKKIAA